MEANATYYLLVNAAAERLLGYGRDTLLRVPRLPEARRLYQAADYWRGAWRLRRKHGSLVPVEAINMRLEIGGRVLYQGLFRDITERKQVVPPFPAGC